MRTGGDGGWSSGSLRRGSTSGCGSSGIIRIPAALYLEVGENALSEVENTKLVREGAVKAPAVADTAKRMVEDKNLIFHFFF
mmetsp:Transcript_6206/g.9109  ORF Transcript_6206/g.9109 Transcript_6206/m.9109 type:complete len:82 (+) Transcript_6206:841-1086(+)